MKSERQIEVKTAEVRSVMKHGLHMRFKKIKNVSLHANSDRNLVLRQQFALLLF